MTSTAIIAGPDRPGAAREPVKMTVAGSIEVARPDHYGTARLVVKMPTTALLARPDRSGAEREPVKVTVSVVVFTRPDQ
jgi:hypothetical protein